MKQLEKGNAKAEAILIQAVGCVIDNICMREQKNLKKYDGFFPIGVMSYLDGVIHVDATVDVLERDFEYSTWNVFDEGAITGDDHLILTQKATMKEALAYSGKIFINPIKIVSAYGSRDYKDSAPGGIKSFFFDCNPGRYKSGFKLINPKGCELNEYDPAVSIMLFNLQSNIGLQFWHENGFSVYIKPDDANIGFSFPLWELSSVKELFKTRDVPAGKKRRAALKHWVCSHARKHPTHGSEQISIKEYLRGDYDANWHGMKVKIIPPLGTVQP